jgi:uncharacterized protein
MSPKLSVIRCPIHGSIFFSQRELELIDNPFFQRLRHISQLGFSSFVFPGAVHTRFSHSIGTTHLAGLVFDQLSRDSVNSLRKHYSRKDLDYFRQILRFAALLHDMGHPPFSHAAESLLPSISKLETTLFDSVEKDRPATHEDFSHMIICHLAVEHEILSKDEAQDIISILSRNNIPSERMNDREGKPTIYPLLCQLINGEIDVDRMDYLLRDSYFAGVPYGKYDLDRLINSFNCCLEEKTQQFLLAIDGEGVPSYEAFLLARVHMFYQIYFHKSLGAYRHYLIQAYKENEIEYKIDGTVDNFLNLTETRLMEEFRANRHKKWSGRIFNRTPAKSLIRVYEGEPDRLLKLKQVEKLLGDNGMETIQAHSSNQYSSQLDKKEIDRDTVLVIEKEFGKTSVIPLAGKSSLLGRKEKLIEIYQLYVHREDFEQAIHLIKTNLDI